MGSRVIQTLPNWTRNFDQFMSSVKSSGNASIVTLSSWETPNRPLFLLLLPSFFFTVRGNEIIKTPEGYEILYFSHWIGSIFSHRDLNAQPNMLILRRAWNQMY